MAVQTEPVAQYPHQLQDEVTQADLAMHIAQHPEMYHVGLVPHIENLLETSGVTVVNVNEQPIVETAIQQAEPVLSQTDNNTAAEHDTTLAQGIAVHEDTVDKSLQDVSLGLVKKDNELRRDDYRQNGILPEGEYEDLEVRRDFMPTIDRIHAMPPQEAREYIRRLKQEAPDSYDLQHYNDYVAYQRALRKNQRQYITERMSVLPKDATEQQRREAFIEAVSYSPDLGARVLRRFKPEPYSSSTLLSPEEISEAAASKESFTNKINQLVTSQPVIMVEQARVLSGLVPQETLQSAVYRVAQLHPNSLVYELQIEKVVKTIFDNPHQVKQFLVGAMTQSSDVEAEVVSNVNLHEFFETSELKDIVAKLVKSGDEKIANRIATFVKAGLISDEQILTYLDTPDASMPNCSLRNRCEVIARPILYGEDSVIPVRIREVATQKVIEHLQSGESDVYEIFNALQNNTIDDQAAKDLIASKLTPTDMSVVLDVLSYSDRDIRLYFTDEQITLAVKDAITNQTDYTVAPLIDKIALLGILSQDEVKQVVDALPPANFLRNLDECKKALGQTDEQIQTTVVEAFNSLLNGDRKYHLETLRPYVTSEQMQDIVLSLARSGVVIDGYVLRTSLKDQLANFDIIQLPYLALEHELQAGEVDSYVITNVLAAIDEIEGIGPAKLKAQELLGVLDSPILLEVMLSADRYFDSQTITDTVTALLKDTECEQQLLYDLLYKTVWAKYISREQVSEFVQSISDGHLSTVVLNKEVFCRYIDEATHRRLTDRYIHTDPAAAYASLSTLSHSYSDIDEMTIVSSVNASRGVAKIDSYLQDTMTRAMAHQREGTKQLLLAEASVAYRSMLVVEQYSATTQLSDIVSNSNATNAQALQLLESVSTILSITGKLDLDSATSAAEVSRLLVQSVGDYLHARIDNVEVVSQDDETVATARILGVYIQQHAKSKGHVSLAATILEQTAAGTYKNWKFGTESPETMQTFKDQGLLPAQLTFEQLQLWAQDEVTDLQDTFSVEAETAVSAVVGVLQDNEQFLMDALHKEDGNTKQEIAEIGAQIASIEKQKQLLKKAEDTDAAAADQIHKLQDESDVLRQQLIELQITEDVQALVNLSADEVKAGALLQADGKKSRSIESIIKRVRKNLPASHVFIADQLNAVVDSYMLQTGEVQRMTATDDSDVLTTLRVGVEPVGSCQNYRTGAINTTLIGYTDPNTKILVLKNAKGSQVARAVYRMLSDKQGAPALHVDTIYTTDSSNATRRALYAHAAQKASAMGVPLYVSAKSQDHDGVMQATGAMQGIALQSQPQIRLSASGSRAPAVYVDANGGVQDDGVYTIDSLNQLTVE